MRVRLTLEPTDRGGRSGAANLAIYRPDARFPFDDVSMYGIHFLSDAWLEPGQTIDVDVWIRSAAERVLLNVRAGAVFEICEGRPVGQATVLEMYG